MEAKVSIPRSPEVFLGLNSTAIPMDLFVNILFWAGIAFWVDGSVALLFQEKWQRWTREMDIQRIAWIEIGVGLAFLVAHYILGRAG